MGQALTRQGDTGSVTVAGDNAQISFELPNLREQRGKNAVKSLLQTLHSEKTQHKLITAPSHLKCREQACLEVCYYPLATA